MAAANVLVIYRYLASTGEAEWEKLQEVGR